MEGLIQKIEVQRKASSNKLKKAGLCVAAVVILALSYFLFISPSGLSFGAVVMWIGVPILIFLLFLQREKEKIEAKVKAEVVPEIMERINPSFVYKPEQYIPAETFEQSGLFSKHADKYEGDDYISGKVGETELSFSEVIAKEEYRDSDNNRSYNTFFHGLFFVADFHKDFEGYIGVMPATSSIKLFNVYTGSRWIKGEGRLENVEMENILFNQTFNVKATDQTVARYVLTPTFMEAMLKFHEKRKQNKLFFSFYDGKMYLALHTGREHFSVNLFDPFDKDDVEEYREDIQLALDVVESLNLNKRIWNK